MEASYNVGNDIKWVNFKNWSLCLVTQFVEKFWKRNILLLMRLNTRLVQLSAYLAIPKL